MFGIGAPELLVIFVVALIVLGPERLPEVARALGKGLAELRKATGGLTDELHNAGILLGQETQRPRPRPDSPPPPPPAVPNAPDSVAAAPPAAPAAAPAAENPDHAKPE